MATNNQVVFALIGAGGISEAQHLPNLTRARNIRLKTVCDLVPELLAQAQQKYCIEHATQDHRTLLADPEIQAVLIATKVEAHVPLVLDSLRAGKHVYVEKPLAETVPQCEELAAAARKSGRLLAVGHNRRMAPAHQLLRKILKAHGGAKNCYYRIADNLYVWRHTAGVAPGTRVLHEVCHIFDLLRYLMDSEVATIYCVASRADDEAILLTFQNGAIASILSSGYMTKDMPKEHIEIVLEYGGVIVEDCVELRTFGLEDFENVYRFAGRIRSDRDIVHKYLYEMQGITASMDLRRIHFKKLRRLEELEKTGEQSNERAELDEYINVHAPNPNYAVNKGWLDAVEHFADCIIDGRPCELSSAEDGIKAMALGYAAIESRESGKIIHAPFTGILRP
jgi:predicted dehydrogenase